MEEWILNCYDELKVHFRKLIFLSLRILSLKNISNDYFFFIYVSKYFIVFY